MLIDSISILINLEHKPIGLGRRTPNATNGELEKAMAAFERYGLSTKRFVPVEHPSHCVYRFQDTCLTRDWMEMILILAKFLP